MDEISLPYLIWPTGRGGVIYPTYRRDGLLRQLKTPDDKRLKGGEEIKKDTRVISAWVPIHEAFERDKEREKSSPEKRPVQWTYKGSIAHAVDDWLQEEVPNLSIGTQKLYAIYAREIRAAHGHRPAATMPRDAFVKMVNERRKKTPGAAQNLANTFQALCGYIEDHPATFELPDDWRNPTVSRRRKKGRKGRKTKKTGWAPWQEWQLGDYRGHWEIGTFERVAFEGYLATGQRGCDVASMRREHYRDGVIAVVQQKTGARIWVPVSDDFQPVLDPWLASHDSEFMFPSEDGTPLSTEAFEARVRRAIKAVKTLPALCKPHGLRYTFATRAIELSRIEKRIDYRKIESIVGHQTLEMARKYTEQIRDSELVIDTMNVGTAAYREQHQHPEDGC